MAQCRQVVEVWQWYGKKALAVGIKQNRKGLWDFIQLCNDGNNGSGLVDS